MSRLQCSTLGIQRLTLNAHFILIETKEENKLREKNEIMMKEITTKCWIINKINNKYARWLGHVLILMLVLVLVFG